MRGRLNIFQRTMVLWNTWHPYNAVHIAQVRGAPDFDRLRTSLHATLARHGLGELRIDPRSSRYAYGPKDAACEIQALPGGPDPHATLQAEIRRQLNLPFDASRPFDPFRFVVVSDREAFFLALVYFHPVADATAVVWLLKEMVSTYAGVVPSKADAAFELYPNPQARWARRYPRVFLRKLARLPSELSHLRRSHRPRRAEAEDLTNGFVWTRLDADRLDALLGAARRWQVTLNDLLLALLLKAVAGSDAGRISSETRNHLSVGCIVDLRPQLDPGESPAFGLFLGSFVVRSRLPEALELRRLAQQVASQTAEIKRQRLPLATPIDLGLARLMMRFFSPRRRRRFYARHHPLAGGITNMNLNRLWELSPDGPLLDYARAVSTGPATPLVLSATTAGNRANLGFSYRTAVFTRGDIQQLVARIQEWTSPTRLAE